MVVFKLRTSLSANMADLIWYIIFYKFYIIYSFVYPKLPFILYRYPGMHKFCSHVVLWIILTFAGRWLSYVGNADGSTRHGRHAPWRVSRTLAYGVVSPSFGRCLGYPVRSLEY